MGTMTEPNTVCREVGVNIFLKIVLEIWLKN